jgi:hypothetical protein
MAEDEKTQNMLLMAEIIVSYISNHILTKISNNKLYYCFLFAKLIDKLRTGGENSNS